MLASPIAALAAIWLKVYRAWQSTFEVTFMEIMLRISGLRSAKEFFLQKLNDLHPYQREKKEISVREVENLDNDEKTAWG
jgi:hypothetical protein